MAKRNHGVERYVLSDLLANAGSWPGRSLPAVLNVISDRKQDLFLAIA
jgi:hypothetical protein